MDRRDFLKITGLSAAAGSMGLFSGCSNATSDRQMTYRIHPGNGKNLKSGKCAGKGVGNEKENGYILTDEFMRTNIPGVYAVGDVRKKFLRQI